MTGPLDHDYLTGFALDQQRAAAQREFDRADKCGRCGHVWHGLLCTGKLPHPCPCPTAYEAAS